MKDFLVQLLEPLDILAKKVTRNTANKLLFLLVAGVFFIMVAIAYNIIARGAMPARGGDIPLEAEESAK